MKRRTPLTRKAAALVLAVSAATGTAAACSKLSPAGLCTILVSVARANWASEPGAVPNTSSPILKRVTLEPTATTRPATSTPRAGFFGSSKPVSNRMTYGVPRM